MKTPRAELKLAKIIADNNAKFLAMSPAQKRVALARDVIHALDLDSFIETHGEYRINTVNEAGGEVCKVCALGALFVAAERNDLVEESNSNAGNEKRGLLDAAGIFAADVLWEIEASFENDRVPMRIIMQHIIDNNGDFDRYAIQNQGVK